MKDVKLTEIVNQSGFPLQIGVTDMIRRTHAEHGWRVLHSEHAWKNDEDDDAGFIDLVLENRHQTSLLVVECKRVLNSTWTFFNAKGYASDRTHARLWITSNMGGAIKQFGWFDGHVDPGSPEAGFCVVDGQDPKARPMLERTAASVVSATEAVAKEEVPLINAKQDALRLFASTIVTTATLKVCEFDPETISLADGTLPECVYREVDWLRFRKQLSYRAAGVKPRIDTPFDALASAKEHTVFVVNANAMQRFVTDFEVGNQGIKS